MLSQCTKMLTQCFQNVHFCTSGSGGVLNVRKCSAMYFNLYSTFPSAICYPFHQKKNKKNKKATRQQATDRCHSGLFKGARRRRSAPFKGARRRAAERRLYCQTGPRNTRFFLLRLVQACPKGPKRQENVLSSTKRPQHLSSARLVSVAQRNVLPKQYLVAIHFIISKKLFIISTSLPFIRALRNGVDHISAHFGTARARRHRSACLSASCQKVDQFVQNW